MMQSSLESGPALSESLKGIQAVSIEAFRHSKLAKLAPFDTSLAALLSVAAHNGSADRAALLHVSADRKIHATASTSSSGFANARTLIAPSDEEFAWLEQVNAPKIIPFDTLRDSWQTAAVALVDKGQDARFFLHVGWRASPTAEQIEQAFGLSSALAPIIGRIGKIRELQQLVVDVASAQSELANSKIAEQATGLLTSNPSGPIDSEVIRVHVGRVLQGTDESISLRDHLEEIRKELGGRQAIADAKEILRQEYNFTEQQAYVALRNASRRLRRPLSDVANEVIVGNAHHVISRQARAV